MKVDDSEEQDLQELNHRILDGNKIVDDNVVAEEQHVAKENGFSTGGTTDDLKDGSSGVVQAQSMLQIQQQPPQTAIVCWERFLHLRSLKVLLVEYDDSTRHVVAALLRNCSYEVVEASNGIQAWRILEDIANHIDLILTEVVMPCLSGIGLLCKIMSHKTRKNVPVIMMSSHDSMGLVFKCLSKGAVDFLVKPIRKNELKNLWQHVWRRCHSSSGSGSESGTHSQKSVKSKSIEKSDNSTGSNDEDDNGSMGLNVGDGSDTGSGTQSSWTKQAADVDSPRPVPSWDAHRVLECADSTCAQVIHSNAETSQNKQIPLPAMRGCRELGEPQDLETVMPRNPDPQPDHPSHVLKLGSSNQRHTVERYSNKLNEEMENGNFDLNSENPSNKPKNEPPNLTGIMTNNTEPLIESTEFEGPNRNFNVSDFNNRTGSNTEKSPSLELSLKRLRGVKDVGLPVQDDRNVLRRSDSSAFSRYNTGSNSYKNLTSNVASASPNDIKLNDKEKEVAQEIQCHSHGDPPNQSSNGGSNNIDMGSTTNATVAKPAALNNKPAVTSSVKCLHPSSFHPQKNERLYAAPHVTIENSDDKTPKVTLTQARGTKQELQMHHCNHHYDHHVHLEMQALDHDDISLKKMAASAPHCGSSNVLGGPKEGNAANYSVNGSASGSNHGSNGQNGSSTAVNAGGMNMESDNGNAGKTGSGNGNGSGSGSGSGSGNRDQDKFAQREAALNKFRQKRKERCFRKKVRYQSRKRLAEQRPRLRGQFVRQTANDSTSSPTDD